jgi:hypothetical protein
MTIDLNKYVEFVNTTTSKPSKEHTPFIDRLMELRENEFPTERLLTAAVGMSAEAGEFTEIVKKIIFQGKPVNQENLFHLKRELGDILLIDKLHFLQLRSQTFMMRLQKLLLLK